MPIARYFLFVGGVLLALLLAVDALFPQQAVVAARPLLRSTRPWCGSVPTRSCRSGWSTTPAFRPLFRRRDGQSRLRRRACRGPAEPPPRPACGRRLPSSSRRRRRSPSRRLSASARSPRAARRRRCRSGSRKCGWRSSRISASSAVRTGTAPVRVRRLN